MSSVNKVILVGGLVADPELRYTPGSRAVCNFRVATTEVFKDKGGQRQERTEYSRVTVWGNQAEACSKYLAKGRSVYIEGKLQTRSYEKDGQKHYATDVVAEHVVFLGGGGQREERPARSAAAPYEPPSDELPPGDGDIPF